MGVEATVRQAGVLHDVGDAGAAVATTPDGARGGLDDAFVRGFLASEVGLSHGGSVDMMSIIRRAGAERKWARGPGGVRPGSTSAAERCKIARQLIPIMDCFLHRGPCDVRRA